VRYRPWDLTNGIYEIEVGCEVRGERGSTTYNANPSGRGMHPSYGTEGCACADIRGDQQELY
jgi:hypothetical protein